MTLRADVHIDSPRLVLGATIRDVPDVALEVEPQATSEVLFVSVRTAGQDPERMEAFESALADDPGVGDFELSMAADAHRIYAIETDVDRRLLSEIAAERGINVCRTHSASGDRGWTFELEVPDKETIVEFRSVWQDLGISFELRRLFYAEGSRPNGFELSETQRETLQTAHENGYFDVPRETSQRELAELLDASPTAISQRLRRGVSALVDDAIATEE